MSTKIAVSLDNVLLGKLDSLIKKEIFPNRNVAIQSAVKEKLARLERNRLAKECAKLNPKFEQAMADDGLSDDLAAWPKY